MSGRWRRLGVKAVLPRIATGPVTSALLASRADLKKGHSNGSDDLGASVGQPIGRVVLIDPREERRAIMGMLVERSPQLTVVGMAGDLGEAEQQIRAEQADVAVVEIQMPVADGLATIGALRAQFPELRIVVCTFHTNSATRLAALSQGADGYLAKPFGVEDLLALAAGPVRTATESAP